MQADLLLRPARAVEFEYVFALHKEGLGRYIARAWGWDEDFQRQGLRREFDAGQFEIAESRGGAAGMISATSHPDHPISTTSSSYPSGAGAASAPR